MIRRLLARIRAFHNREPFRLDTADRRHGRWN